MERKNEDNEKKEADKAFLESHKEENILDRFLTARVPQPEDAEIEEYMKEAKLKYKIPELVQEHEKMRAARILKKCVLVLETENPSLQEDPDGRLSPAPLGTLIYPYGKTEQWGRFSQDCFNEMFGKIPKEKIFKKVVRFGGSYKE